MRTAQGTTAPGTTARGTTARGTTAPGTTARDDLADALATLAAAAAQAVDDACSRAVLAVGVQQLEDAAEAWLGDTDDDPLVVLQRRIGRAHAWLLRSGGGHVDVDLLRGLARALQPAAATEGAAQLRPSPAAALARC